MKRIIKYNLLAFISVFSIVFTSCIHDQEKRTWEMEQDELRSYLEGLISAGHDIDTTALGVYYVKIEEGEGEFPKQGDTLTIGYAGYFIDGTMFDSSELNFEDGEYTFRFIDDPKIPGFEDGLKIMNKGAKVQMVIPSDLAYGSVGTAVIPNYATLIFVVKMINIKPVSETD
ncbi:MAG: FKBP-type peptidyl-prolyl cis-trans isomerase [Prolixibacteraceae bacterium]|nr:FKBP-type peptidyl-prolyl cis-trans isomerase [Prolixibacteraceae bacterium]MBN2772819.1 FKBP-type peptidyl-prolyl cis-trans isomerase [Prolixibacteraceae bacterium]